MNKVPTVTELARSFSEVMSLNVDLGELRFESLKRNEARRDFFDKVLFKVTVPDENSYIVMLAEDLGDIVLRTNLFAENHPEIAIPIISEGKCGDWGFIVSKHYTGTSLEVAVSEGRIDSEKAIEIAIQLFDALDRTVSQSDIEKLDVELQTVFSDLRNCAFFNHWDVEFLVKRIYPKILEELSDQVCRLSCTNGDFIARNILLTNSGEIKLIDYEFANLTHFYWENCIRWKRYSSFIKNSQLNNIFDDRFELTVAKEILFLLKQAILDSENVSLGSVSVSVERYLFRLKELIGELDEGVRGSLLWNNRTSIDVLSKEGTTIAQLFWSWSGGFSEEDSLRRRIAVDEPIHYEQKIEVVNRGDLQIRFDLCETQALLEVESLRILADNGEYLFEADRYLGWDAIRFDKHAWKLSSSENLFVFAVGTDPIFYFPKMKAKSLSGVGSLVFIVEYTVHSNLKLVRDHLEKCSILEERVELECCKRRLKSLGTKVDHLSENNSQLLDNVQSAKEKTIKFETENRLKNSDIENLNLMVASVGLKLEFSENELQKNVEKYLGILGTNEKLLIENEVIKESSKNTFTINEGLSVEIEELKDSILKAKAVKEDLLIEIGVQKEAFSNLQSRLTRFKKENETQSTIIRKLEKCSKKERLHIDKIIFEKSELRRRLDFVISNTGKRGANAFAVSNGEKIVSGFFENLFGKKMQFSESEPQCVNPVDLEEVNQDALIEEAQKHLILECGLFDKEWYLEKYPQLEREKDLVLNYLRSGGNEGRSPSPYFDSHWYLEENPDVKKAKLNPLIHFLTHGIMEGRSPNRLFNAKWYQGQYSEDVRSSETAIFHFVKDGDRKAYSPSKMFHSEWYLEQNSDVVKSKLAPFYHYITYGLFEGRLATSVDSCRFLSINDVEVRFFDSLKGKEDVEVDSKKTVLLVAHSAGHALFGAERSFLDVCEALKQKSYNVYAVVPSGNSEYVNLLREQADGVILFPYKWWKKGVEVDPQVVGVFQYLLRTYQVSVLYGNTIMSREAFIAAKVERVPSILHAREIIHEDEQLRNLIGLDTHSIVDQVRDRADLIIGNSKATVEAFECDIEESLVYNTVDSNAFTLVENSFDETIYVGIISSNLAKKGLEDFFELACLAKSRIPHLVFRVIGPETEFVKILVKRIADEAIDVNLEFCGYFDDFRKAISKVNVIVNFSIFAESFGRTIAEAMMAMRPVIVYDHGALPELVEHGKNGYVIPYREYGAAIDYLDLMVGNPKLCRELGCYGRNKAIALFDKPEFQDRIGQVFRDFLEKHELRPNNEILISTVGESQLKIAYFVWHFPVPSETFVLNELRYLVNSGCDVCVYCRQIPNPDFVLDFDIDFEQVNSPEQLAEKALNREITQFHGHFTFPTVTEFLWPAAIISKIPFTFIAHAQDIFKYDNIKSNRIAEISKSKLCQKILTLGTFHKNFLVELGVPAEKILINSNGIDISNFEFSGDYERYDKPLVRICSIQRFVEKKGLLHIVNSAKALSEFSVEIDLYGYGPQEDLLKRKVEELGVSNVRFKGSLNNRFEVGKVLREHDLLLVPCVRTETGDMDGIPTVIMEAMASGITVAATPIASIPDLVEDGVTGFLINDELPEGILNVYKKIRRTNPFLRETIAFNARKRVEEFYDANKLTERLVRLWTAVKFDIVIVSWNNLDELKEVIRRVQLYTMVPYELVICDNASESDVQVYLDDLERDCENIRIIRQESNLFVGPGTNVALTNCSSEYAIYICGKEGYVLNENWERSILDFMDDNPLVGIAGTLCYSPSYPDGRGYVESIDCFSKFRNQSFAIENPERTFQHVQGGLFVLRRRMFEEIGGFSSAVPHNGTDIEYSYYAESCGWRLGQVPGMVSVYNKSRPGLFARIDKTVSVVHPGALDLIGKLESVKQGSTLCNVCEGIGFGFLEEASKSCKECGSRSDSRLLWRYLTESMFTYRRLSAVAVGLQDSAIKRLWQSQFQGSLYDANEFSELLAMGNRIDNRDGGTHLVYLNGDFDSLSAQIASEVSRLLVDGGVLLFQVSAHLTMGSANEFGESLEAMGVLFSRRIHYLNSNNEFGSLPMFEYKKGAV